MDDTSLERLTRDVRVLTAIIARLSHISLEQQLSQWEFGVSAMQFGVMRSLWRGSHTISELSRKFVVDPSTLVPVIDSLEKKGLVVRSRDPNDRRRVPVQLTESGRELLGREMPVSHDDPFYRALTMMGEERSRQLRGLLEEVLRAMPEGGNIMDEVQSRLDALNGADKAMRQDSAPPCAHGHEQRHLKGRAAISQERKG